MNICALNARACTFIKETLPKLKTHIELHTIIVGDFNTPLFTNGQVIDTETKQGNSETKRGYDQMDLTDIYRTFYTKTKEYTFFSASHGTFSKMDHLIGHKTNVNQYTKIQIIPCIPSDHHGQRFIFNNSKN